MNLPQLTAGGSLRTIAGSTPARGLAGEWQAGLGMTAITHYAMQSEIAPYCSCTSAANATAGSGAQAAAPAVNVFSVGGIAARFPSLSLEKEFLQTLDESDQDRNIDWLVARYLKQTDNLYIAREMTWLFQQGNTDVYVIHPQSNYELQNLVALLYDPTLSDVGSLIWGIVRGTEGTALPDDGRVGGGLPVLTAKEVYIASSQSYLSAITELTNGTPQNVLPIFAQVFGFAINAGNTDPQRAINYVVLQYISAYAQVYNLRYPSQSQPTSELPTQEPYSLTGIRTAPSAVQGKNKVLDVIFSFTGLQTGLVQQWYCSVDVTGQFPFINAPFQRYYGIG
ncbi:MAG TPA: hypothetical protein VHI13_08525 [Candidatus Kapabacteria bacterium]|nr:hypothetical protein [Candidatus Kapabacteria bacterium]